MSANPSFDDLFGSGDVETFLGLPKAAPDSLDGLRAAIFSVQSATPYSSVGPYCANAPDALRKAAAPYAAILSHVDFDMGAPLLPDGGVADCGDLLFDPSDTAGNRTRITHAAGQALDAGVVPVVLGGDDSVPAPAIAAFAGRGDLTILQIDAHIDWREDVEGERWGLSSTMRRASEMAHVTGMVQMGMRGVGSARPGEKADAEAWGSHLIPAREIHAHGIGVALDKIPEGASVFISIDVDGLDPSIIPAVLGREPGGLTYTQVTDVIAGVAARARIAGAALVELMPERDVDGLGTQTAARIVCNLLGHIVRQDTA